MFYLHQLDLFGERAEWAQQSSLWTLQPLRSLPRMKLSFSVKAHANLWQCDPITHGTQVIQHHADCNPLHITHTYIDSDRCQDKKPRLSVLNTQSFNFHHFKLARIGSFNFQGKPDDLWPNPPTLCVLTFSVPVLDQKVYAYFSYDIVSTSRTSVAHCCPLTARWVDCSSSIIVKCIV